MSIPKTYTCEYHSPVAWENSFDSLTFIFQLCQLIHPNFQGLSAVDVHKMYNGLCKTGPTAFDFLHNQSRVLELFSLVRKLPLIFNLLQIIFYLCSILINDQLMQMKSKKSSSEITILL